jgi:hypothetical protein
MEASAAVPQLTDLLGAETCAFPGFIPPSTASASPLQRRAQEGQRSLTKRRGTSPADASMAPAGAVVGSPLKQIRTSQPTPTNGSKAPASAEGGSRSAARSSRRVDLPTGNIFEMLLLLLLLMLWAGSTDRQHCVLAESRISARRCASFHNTHLRGMHAVLSVTLSAMCAKVTAMLYRDLLPHTALFHAEHVCPAHCT